MNPSVYIKIDGKEVGPIEWDQLTNDVKRGSLNPDIPMRFEDSVIWTSYKTFTDKQLAEKGSKQLLMYLCITAGLILIAIIILKPKIAGLIGVSCFLLGASMIFANSWSKNKENIGHAAISLSLGSIPIAAAPAPKLSKGLLLTGVLLIAYTMIRALYF
jgi:hypothetical protein